MKLTLKDYVKYIIDYISNLWWNMIDVLTFSSYKKKHPDWASVEEAKVSIPKNDDEKRLQQIVTDFLAAVAAEKERIEREKELRIRKFPFPPYTWWCCFCANVEHTKSFGILSEKMMQQYYAEKETEKGLLQLNEKYYTK